MPNPRLFIASSSHSKSIVVELVTLLAKEFDVVPWYDGFPAGQLTFQVLVDARSDYDCGLCVFGHDDLKHVAALAPSADASAPVVEPIARDNVVLEFGLFLGALGPSRVLILADDRVRIPSDLAALKLLKFDGVNATLQAAQLSKAAATIVELWKPLPAIEERKAPPLDDHALGFKQTLEEIEQRLKQARVALHVSGAEHQAVTDEPIRFDLTDECVSTYAEAVGRTRSRFFATTYLMSGFWSTPDPRVLEVNMALSQRPEVKGQLRRIFMLERPLDEDIAHLEQELAFYRRSHRFEDIAAKRAELEALTKNIREQLASGFEVRVGYDTPAALGRLPTSLQFRPHSTEIALFDQFRVDVYANVKNGRIQAAHCFTPMVRNFAGVLQAADAYFQELWSTAKPVEDVLSRMMRVLDQADRQIDYEPQWLAAFELDLNPDDVELKAAELAKVKTIVEARVSRPLASLLDVGTGTARYPIAFEGLVSADGIILGIDHDPDCVAVARRLLKKLGLHRRIEVRQEDFLVPNGDFDRRFSVITCTLGTLSHFGLRRDSPDDNMQSALVRMRGLLESTGVLVLGNWSDSAVAEAQLLSIYGARERQRVAQNTASRQELRERLQRAGLAILEEVSADRRLDLFICGAGSGH